MSRRFKDIVPAMVDKAAADKNDITHGIDAAQFPDRINEDDRVTRPLPFFVAKDGAQAYRETETFGKTRDFMGPSRLSRGNEEPCLGNSFWTSVKASKSFSSSVGWVLPATMTG